jgi:hypothetical protein
MLRENQSHKGIVPSTNKKDTHPVCNPCESDFNAFKRRPLAMSQVSFDLYHRTADSLSKLMKECSSAQTVADRRYHKVLNNDLKQLADQTIPHRGLVVQHIAAGFSQLFLNVVSATPGIKIKRATDGVSNTNGGVRDERNGVEFGLPSKAPGLVASSELMQLEDTP